MWVSNFDLHQHAYRIYQGTFNTGSIDLWPSNLQGLICQSQSLIPHTRTSIHQSGQTNPKNIRGCSVYILTDNLPTSKQVHSHFRTNCQLQYQLKTEFYNNSELQLSTKQLGDTSLQYTHRDTCTTSLSLHYNLSQSIQYHFTSIHQHRTSSNCVYWFTNTVTYHSQ